MPWHTVSTMSLREEFVLLAQAQTLDLSDLCRHYGISRKTGYKWLARFEAHGRDDLVDRPRRPHTSPARTPVAIEEQVLAVRRAHPAWGARKLRAYLQQHLPPGLSLATLPAPSTLTAILRRHGYLDPGEAGKHRAWQRFEHPAPNQLWQMDFKGGFPLSREGHRCFPLTVLDDHSRFALGLYACANQQGLTVRAHLTELFRRYGLPERMTMDNGAPWGDTPEHPYTPLTVWLVHLGIGVSHSRPYHPQTQGKDERFHRTLQAELLQGRVFHDLLECQTRFDAWRSVYNLERPHEALRMEVPARRYQVSGRRFPEQLPPIEYGPEDVVRHVQFGGELHFQGRIFKVSKAFRGYPVAVRPTVTDGLWQVFFCNECIGRIDLHSPAPGD